MINLTTILDSIVNNIKNIMNFSTSHLKFEDLPEVNFILKMSITTYNLCVVIILVLFLINCFYDLFFNHISNFDKKFKYVNYVIISSILVVLFFKLYLTLKVESIVGTFFYDIKKNFYSNNNNLTFFESFITVTSSFSDSILILSIFVGIICLDLLGSKNLFSKFSNLTIFYLFSFFVITMVSTDNLLIMFISFEFIFLPTIYFAYTKGYSKKIDIASEILIYWTLFGSFLVLCNLSYLYYQYNTLNWLYLVNKKFSQTELIILFLNFLLGFGIKIPLAPLHYWLLKVHVEAPTAFSIYLSGFLVKSALYCLYMFLSVFNDTNLYLLLTVWVIYSLIISTLGFSRQVDIKKLIAWATVQEMSFMLFFLTLKQLFLLHTCIIFIVLHGLMSSYMFYIVDILQRRFKTRSLFYIKGLNLLFPEITKYIWYLILLFSGFPLTVKFFLEWSIVSLLIESNKFILLIILFFLNFLGVIFFCKVLFNIIYGSPNIEKGELDICDIQKKEKYILNSLLFFISMLFFFIFTI